MLHPPPDKPVTPLTVSERAALLHSFLKTKKEGDGSLHVFAYGSLIWDPCFAFVERRKARLQGWVRRTCLWSLHARGKPDAPGLVYGLDREKEGHCHGVVFTLSKGDIKISLERLWDREMHTAVYRPTWLDVETSNTITRAIAFVVNRAHPLYAGTSSPEETAAIIAQAHGKFGSCADYYRDTITALAKQGLEDTTLSSVVELL